jgi:hypothetical protein
VRFAGGASSQTAKQHEIATSKRREWPMPSTPCVGINSYGVEEFHHGTSVVENAQ